MNSKQRDDLFEYEDTTNDTRTTDNDNIIFNSSKSQNNTYNCSTNINNLIDQKDTLIDDNIITQRENRRILSLIKRVLQKNEDAIKAKKNIKDILTSYNRNIILLKDDQSNTLLHIYVISNDLLSLKIILDAYIDIIGISEKFYSFLFMKNMNGDTIFDLCVKKENIPLIKLLYQQMEKTENYSDIANFIDYLKNNIFNISAENNKIYPIIFFYEKLRKFYGNKKVNILDSKDMRTKKDKMTPILYSAKNNNLKLLLILSDLGANLNSQDNKGYTALHYAVENNNEKMVKHLLLRGANKYITDKNNLNAYNLAVLRKYWNLADILYHPNCCQNLMYGEEIGKLTKKRSMLLLISYLIFNIFYKLIIFFRFFFVIKDIAFDLSDFKIYVGTNEKQYELGDFLSCLKEDCIPEISVFYICSFIDFVLLIYIIIFKCSNKVYLPKILNVKDKLSKLYEQNENICVKCGITKKPSTKHCLICDRCVDDWDHHCYWLNSCINKKIYCKFKLFLYISFVFLLSNLVYYVYSVYLILSSKEILFQEILKIEKYSLAYYLIVIPIVTIEIIIIILMLFILIFINFPLIKYVCQMVLCKKKQEENIENLIDPDDSFNKVFEEKEDEIIIISSG